jgi:selenide,water dikinase
MQCRGCGCKLGTDSLGVGLQALAWDGAEDAAIVGGQDSTLVASTDFFASPVDDPFLAGRIAAMHAASDIVASGARPTDALANVVIPEGEPKSQQQVLHDFMSGANEQFESMGAEIVGGHTIVGPRMEAGFTVLGKTIGGQPIRKGNLRVGDRLFLTKPLGVGVLLAAHMRARCRAEWYRELIETMLRPQQHYAWIAHELGLTGGTDVTGFGLAGHLIEMLDSSQLAAELFLDQIPILPGVAELIEAGVESSLAPDNRKVAHRVLVETGDQSNPSYQVLFDPQTCGGLLLAVDPDNVDRFQTAAAEGKLGRPVEIGRVILRERQSIAVRVVRESGGAAEPAPYTTARN